MADSKVKNQQTGHQGGYQGRVEQGRQPLPGGDRQAGRPRLQRQGGRQEPAGLHGRHPQAHQEVRFQEPQRQGSRCSLRYSTVVLY